MKTLQILLAVFSVCVILQGCSSGDNTDPYIGPSDPEQSASIDIELSFNENTPSMTMTAEASFDGFGERDVVEYGFYYGYRFISRPEDGFDTFTKEVVTGDSPVEFGQTLEYDSRQGVGFYCFAYVSTEHKTFYSDITRLYVSGYRVTITTSSDFSDLTFERATVYGHCEVANATLFPIIERGFCYINTHTRPGVSPTLTVNDGVTVAGEGSGDFSATITGLEPAAAYKVRAYARTYDGVTYSQSYVTLPMYLKETFVPQLTIRTDTNDAMLLKGIVTGDRGYLITEKGFCYNALGVTPTVNDTKIVYEEAGLGNFEHSFSGMTPGKYYVRAYAVNEAGAGYSYSTIVLTVE